jgi:hypothetical protein
MAMFILGGFGPTVGNARVPTGAGRFLNVWFRSSKERLNFNETLPTYIHCFSMHVCM